MSNFSKIRITFGSGGISCSGYLYLPEQSTGDVPCIVLANGFSGTMDWNMPNFAERFVGAGFAALIFDYRYFGESEGEPRQLVSVAKQREDIRNAITFVRSYQGIDPARIALWGSSLGGGHVIDVASNDPGIAAVVSQIPGIDLVSRKARGSIKISAWVLSKIIAAACWDAIRGLAGFSPYYMKVFGDPGETVVFSDQRMRSRIEAMIRSGSTWQNRFTPRFYLAAPRYRAGTAERIEAPLLVCIADKEDLGSPKFQEWVARQAPRGEVKHYSAGHFDFYRGDVFEQVVKDQTAFFRTHLADKYELWRK